MSFLGIGKEIAEPVDAIGNALDKLFTSDSERAQAAAVMEKLKQQPQVLQIELNKLEAVHRSIWVAGARPFILWSCGIGINFVFWINPLIQWFTNNPGPKLPTEALMTLVTSILGLGAYRTVEKIKGVSR